MVSATILRRVAESVTQHKVVLALVDVLATAALVLAALGLYGVMAEAVATRREFAFVGANCASGPNRRS